MMVGRTGAAHERPLLVDRGTFDLADMGRSVLRPYKDWMIGAGVMEFAKTQRLRSFVAQGAPQDDKRYTLSRAL